MHWHDWLALFGQYLMLSLLSISGAITTVPDMHRYLVDQNGWLTDAQFSSSVAIAQAAPGPNVLFVALMGWNVGINAGGGIGAGPRAWALGLLGLAITMVGIMLPSTTLTYFATRWGHRNRDAARGARLQAGHGAGGGGPADRDRLGAGRRQPRRQTRPPGTCGC